MIWTFFRKARLPDKLPKDMQQAVAKLKKSRGKEDCLKQAYNLLGEKYKGYPLRTYTRLWMIFEFDINKIWARKDFIHCTTMNYLYRVLIINSGFFTDNDIEQKWTAVWWISV